MAGLIILPVAIIGTADGIVSVSMLAMNFYFDECKVKGIGFASAAAYLCRAAMCCGFISMFSHRGQGKPLSERLNPYLGAAGLILSLYSTYGLVMEMNTNSRCMRKWMYIYEWIFVSLILLFYLVVAIKFLSSSEERTRISNEPKQEE